MCGIAGFLDFNRSTGGAVHCAAARSMANLLRHRGPDDEGVWVDAEAGVAFAHRRLSIVDLSEAGHQPMISESGRYVITYNGEIYNTPELRAAVEQLGRGAPRYRGHSDMAATIFSQTLTAPLAEFPAEFLVPRWYAACTCSNHEKQVAVQLAGRGVAHFLPLYETVHRWKDRRVRLQLPLFPGYIFVRLPLRERLRVLEVPSVVRLVGFGQTLAVALPDAEIEAFRSGLEAGLRAQPHPYLTIGRRVRIKNGPLAGMEGILQRRKGNFRVVVSVDLIRRSIALEADASDLEPLPTLRRPR